MSYSTKTDEITVNGVTYDVERKNSHTDMTMALTLTLDGEPAFEGLEGTLGTEEYIDEGMSPRDWSNVGVIAVSYRGYNLGDEDIKEINFEVECPRCEGSGYAEWEEYEGGPAVPDEDGEMPCPDCEEHGYKIINPVDYFKKERGARVVLPLIVYEHSGITMRVGHVGDIALDSAGWDTSFVGFTFDTPESVKECIGDNATDEQIEAALRQEIDTYAGYLEGDVTFWSVNDEETNFNEVCGGYVGNSDGCEEDCFEAMKDAIEKRLAEVQERRHWAERDTVTV